jgi:tetratricopeptide (TPR) repeat protein
VLSRTAAIGFAALCLIAVVGLARAESIALEHHEAVTHIAAGEWDMAAGPAESALAQDPDVPAYQLTRALVAAKAADWTTAERLFGQAASMDDLPQSWLGLALAAVELDRPTEAVTNPLEQALRLGAGQPAIAYAAGVIYDRLGMAAAADAAYAEALANAPSLAGDPSWTMDPALATRLDGIMDLAVSANPAADWELALMTGDVVGARDLAGDDDSIGLFIDAWDGDGAALARLQSTARSHPMNGSLLVRAARASAHAGDQAAAAAFRRLARYVTVGANIPGYDVRLGEQPSRIDPAAGTLTPFYGSYLYRRPTPADLIPGDLPRLVYDDPADGSSTASAVATE